VQAIYVQGDLANMMYIVAYGRPRVLAHMVDTPEDFDEADAPEGTFREQACDKVSDEMDTVLEAFTKDAWTKSDAYQPYLIVSSVSKAATERLEHGNGKPYAECICMPLVASPVISPPPWRREREGGSEREGVIHTT
jgi:hypothetical protein